MNALIAFGLRGYLVVNVLLAAGALSLGLVGVLSRRGLVPAQAAANAARGVLALALVLPWPLALLPPSLSFEGPPAQVFDAVTRGAAATMGTSPVTGVGALPTTSPLPLLFALALAGAATCALFRYLRVARAVNRMPLVRRVGRVELRAGEGSVPASLRLKGRAVVLLPFPFELSPEEDRLCLQHELLHHRRGDPQWLLGAQLVRTLCAWNPAAHLLVRALVEAQELACDEAVMKRQRVSAEAYARCLVRVAEQTLARRLLPGAVGMSSRRRSGLRRRVERLLAPVRPRRWLSTLALAGALGGVSAAAVAAGPFSGGAPLTLAQARALAAAAQATIPLRVDEAVLTRINQALRTREGRAWYRAALARMPTHLPAVERTLRAYGLPPELAALPLLESGYRTDLVSPGLQAAGLWQFIPTTARQYGLRVDAAVDERVDVALETEAAARYLRDLHDELGDWPLALKAYNEGAARVKALIDAHGTRDAWALEAKDSREGYLGRAVAAFVIYRHPELTR